MKWLEIKINFESHHKEIATEVISNLLLEFGLQGVVIEDKETDIEKTNEKHLYTEVRNNAIIGYLPMNQCIEEKRELLIKRLKDLKKEIPIHYWIVYREINDDDWSESWKAYFWPLKITDRIIVKPTWRDYNPDPQDIVIEIDPGMAFGTGTHPTTQLCAMLIEKYLKRGDSFLDIGTGSGILMIAAAKLGARKGLGIDHDEVAVQTTQSNLSVNQINLDLFRVIRGYLLDNIQGTYDFIAANITSEVIMNLLNHVTNVMKKHGILICSGIIEENKECIIKRMKKEGFRIIEVLIKEEWVAVAGRFWKNSKI